MPEMKYTVTVTVSNGHVSNGRMGKILQTPFIVKVKAWCYDLKLHTCVKYVSVTLLVWRMQYTINNIFSINHNDDEGFCNVKTGDFIVASFRGKKTVKKICEVLTVDNPELEVQSYWNSHESKSTFVQPAVIDRFWMDAEDIVYILYPPHMQRDRYIFDTPVQL